MEISLEELGVLSVRQDNGLPEGIQMEMYKTHGESSQDILPRG